VYKVIFFIIFSGVRLNPLGTVATTGLLYQPQMIDDVMYDPQSLNVLLRMILLINF
jgi:hypothetical protein